MYPFIRFLYFLGFYPLLYFNQIITRDGPNILLQCMKMVLSFIKRTFFQILKVIQVYCSLEEKNSHYIQSLQHGPKSAFTFKFFGLILTLHSPELLLGLIVLCRTLSNIIFLPWAVCIKKEIKQVNDVQFILINLKEFCHNRFFLAYKIYPV